MSKKTKNVKFSFDTGILLSGVSYMYQDLLDSGLDSEQALHQIMSDTILNYHLDKKHPKWAPSSITEVSEGNYEVELEKVEFY